MQYRTIYSFYFITHKGEKLMIDFSSFCVVVYLQNNLYIKIENLVY